LVKNRFRFWFSAFDKIICTEDTGTFMLSNSKILFLMFLTSGSVTLRDVLCSKKLVDCFDKKIFIYIFLYFLFNFIQLCFISHPSDSTASENVLIETRSVASLALACRRSNRSARSHHFLRFVFVIESYLDHCLEHQHFETGCSFYEFDSPPPKKKTPL
jgi:hypothetical protein